MGYLEVVAMTIARWRVSRSLALYREWCWTEWNNGLDSEAVERSVPKLHGNGNQVNWKYV